MRATAAMPPFSTTSAALIEFAYLETAAICARLKGLIAPGGGKSNRADDCGIVTGAAESSIQKKSWKTPRACLTLSPSFNSCR